MSDKEEFDFTIKTPREKTKIKIVEPTPLKIIDYPDVVFKPKEEEKSINLLVIGQTGNGKTSFLNALINVLMDIKQTDKFRYLLIKEKQDENNQINSQTSEINIYNVLPEKYPPIKIIDTPGLGDTRGKYKDKETVKQFLDLFANRINYINCICLIVKSGLSRLDEQQLYIFKEIMKIFSDDIKINFVVIFTHYQGRGKPINAIKALEHKNCCFSEVIPYISKPWYYCIDNKIMFCDELDDQMNEIFFKVTTENINKFIQEKLIKNSRVSVGFSKEVLTVRENISDKFNKASNEFYVLINKINEISNKAENVKKLYDELKEIVIDKNTEKKMIELIKEKSKKTIKLYNSVESRLIYAKKVEEYLDMHNKNLEDLENIYNEKENSFNNEINEYENLKKEKQKMENLLYVYLSKINESLSNLQMLALYKNISEVLLGFFTVIEEDGNFINLQRKAKDNIFILKEKYKENNRTEEEFCDEFNDEIVNSLQITSISDIIINKHNLYINKETSLEKIDRFFIKELDLLILDESDQKYYGNNIVELHSYFMKKDNNLFSDEILCKDPNNCTHTHCRHHQHGLVYLISNRNWICDICRKEFKKEIPTNYCSICDFDGCEKCIKQNKCKFPKEKRKRTDLTYLNFYDHIHKLVYCHSSRSKLSIHGYVCNICYKSYSNTEWSFYCTKCDYDLCLKCAGV